MSAVAEREEAADAMRDRQLRLLEALLFAAAEPLDEASLKARLGAMADLRALLGELATLYAGRGITLVEAGGRWAFRTAPDLAHALRVEIETPKKPSRAAVETLAIIAYHQPVTRAEIESVRGVTTSKGTLDALLQAGWVRPGGRRETPGRPLTWVTTEAFLDHFGLSDLRDLPRLDELEAAGLLDARPVLDGLPGAEGGAETTAEPDDEPVSP